LSYSLLYLIRDNRVLSIQTEETTKSFQDISTTPSNLNKEIEPKHFNASSIPSQANLNPAFQLLRSNFSLLDIENETEDEMVSSPEKSFIDFPKPPHCGYILSNRILNGFISGLTDFPWSSLLIYEHSKRFVLFSKNFN